MDQSQAVQDGHGYVGHIVPFKLLVGIWIVLLALTVVTVLATLVDLGALNIWLALFIAAVKASFVALYFMHLRWDSPLNGVILICALLFVAIFISITLLDTIEYQPTHDVPRGVEVR